MSFAIKKQDGVVVVDVEGQLIVGNRQELKLKMLDELDRGGRKFLIDFAKTGYIDSSGLGCRRRFASREASCALRT